MVSTYYHMYSCIFFILMSSLLLCEWLPFIKCFSSVIDRQWETCGSIWFELWKGVFTPHCAHGFSWLPQPIGLPIDPTWLRQTTGFILVSENKLLQLNDKNSRLFSQLLILILLTVVELPSWKINHLSPLMITQRNRALLNVKLFWERS